MPSKVEGSQPFWAFFATMARDPDAAVGGTQAYLALEPRLRDAWIAELERCVGTPGPPLGACVLTLFAAETDARRRRRLWACALEAPFALRRREADGWTWRLLRPLRCELAAVASVRTYDDGVIGEAEFRPLSAQGWELGFEGVALALAIDALALAVVREPARLQPVLRPFVELFVAEAA